VVFYTRNSKKETKSIGIAPIVVHPAETFPLRGLIPLASKLLRELCSTVQPFTRSSYRQKQKKGTGKAISIRINYETGFPY